jgi:hypothetical protein
VVQHMTEKESDAVGSRRSWVLCPNDHVAVARIVGLLEGLSDLSSVSNLGDIAKRQRRFDLIEMS